MTIPGNRRIVTLQVRDVEAAAVPGLLGIANQAHRARDPDDQINRAYSLADAMRDAVWRKKTAAKLDILISQRRPRCANDTENSTATPMKGC